MRALAAGIALLLAACTASPRVVIEPTPSPTHELGAYAVTAFLDLSGSRGPRGDAQRAAMQQWADAQRAITRVKLRIFDVAGSDAKLLVELKRASESGDADAFVIGVPIVLDDALLGAIAIARRPVLFTLPIREPAGEAAHWIFGLAPTTDAIARALVDALPSRSSPAVIVNAGTLPSGREEVALTAVFRTDGRPMPFVLSAAPDQRDAFVQRLRPFATGATALFFTGPATAYLEPQRLLPGTEGTSAPLVFLSYLTDANDASRLGEAASGARWPALRRTVGASLATHAASATDALALIAGAADPSGDAERSRIRMESTTFAGIATTYSFSASRRNGADPRDLALVTWENGRIVAARPAATPTATPSPSRSR
jgi:hypothetical protein